MAFDSSARKCLSFDDVLLVPNYSEIESRHHVCLDVADWDGYPIIVGESSFSLPIFASPMDTVVDAHCAVLFAAQGVSPILHRYSSFSDQLNDYDNIMMNVTTHDAPIGVAIGTGHDNLQHAYDLYSAGCRLFCVDVAHGHHRMALDIVSDLRNVYDDVFIVAGNVATVQGFNALADAGANAVRVGIGGGSVCSTRLVTGHGIPTFQSVVDCAHSEKNCYIIADGGMRTSGDVVKAYAAGADFVMLGSMFAGKLESPGDTKQIDGKTYKNYRGMASANAQLDWRGKVSVEEGVDSWRCVTESIEESVQRLVAGIRSGLSYSGCDNIGDFYAKSEFVKITPQALGENAPHAIGAVL